MRRGRILTGVVLLLAAVGLFVATAASAATPQDICKDLKDGKVDGTYTAAEWTAFFSDPTIQGYGCGGTIVPPGAGVVAPTNAARQPVKQAGVGSQPTSQTPNTAATPLGTTRSAGTLPFTGVQLTVFLVVGLALVGTGLALRATGRRRPQE